MSYTRLKWSAFWCVVRQASSVSSQSYADLSEGFLLKVCYYKELEKY